MTEHLLYIFNNALYTGYFPDTLKHAHMIFIPKGNTSQYNIKNYRPITLLDIQGKLFDKILNTRLTHHLDRHNINNDSQHRFRKNRSTQTALATFYETLANIKQHQYTANIILRDVSKVFDKIWHTGLKHKIHQLGLHACFTYTSRLHYRQNSISIHTDWQLQGAILFTRQRGTTRGMLITHTLQLIHNLLTYQCSSGSDSKSRAGAGRGGPLPVVVL